MEEHKANIAGKRELRRRMAELRDAVPAEERLGLSERLCRVAAEQLLDPLRKRLGRPLSVCLYGAFRSEADPAQLAMWCWMKGDEVFAPRVLADGTGMEVRRLDSSADWTTDRRGVPEPDPERTVPLPDPAGLDTVLVPGLAFDRRGRRIGYGGGHYDRLYARVAQTIGRRIRGDQAPAGIAGTGDPTGAAGATGADVPAGVAGIAGTGDPPGPLWIGFAYSFQVVDEELPVEPHDLRLDAVATERGLLWFGRRSE